MLSVKINPLVFLAGAGALGVGLFVLDAMANLGSVGHELAVALGGALVIAGALGGTVDLWLKQRLLREAFSATFGYLLPEELRGQLKWIYEQETICSNHEETLTLSATDDPDLYELRIEVRRTVRNVSGKTLKDNAVGFSVDEFFRAGYSSEIRSLGWATGTHRCDLFEMDPAREPYVLNAYADESVNLRPDEEYTMWAEGIEIRLPNDDFFMTAHPATANPRVTVRVPEGFGHEVTFGSPDERRPLSQGVAELQGTLLPGQILRVRWWRNSDIARRIVEAGDDS